MSPEERTRALVAVAISKETIYQFGTPKDWAWLALHITPFPDDPNRWMRQSGLWYSRVVTAYQLLTSAGAKKRGIKTARLRLEKLLRRYAKLLPRYYLKRVAVRSKGSRYPATNYTRNVLVELSPGTRVCDLRNINSPCVVRIVQDSGAVHVGKTDRSKGVVILKQLQERCARLNMEAKHGTSKT